MNSLKTPRRAPATSLLLASLVAVGCSFPTSEFSVGVPPTDVPAVDRPAVDRPTADVPVVDAPATDVPVTDVLGADVPVTDVPVADVDDAAAVDAPVVDAPADAEGADVPSDVPMCPTGQSYCVDGCVDLDTSSAHCGRCGNQCAAANAASVCAAGACAFTCNPGYADCDGVAANGCEANLAAPATCGSCMTRCDATNGTAACAAGACAIACAAGFGNCDGSAANGCETNLQTDATHCGACSTACANTNGTPACAAGACAIACATGYGNCDANAANGCETSLATDRAHCGSCAGASAVCASAQSCVGSACVTVCPYMTCTTAGVNSCVDLATSAANCGACGRACALPNATPRCTASACAVATCNAGYGNCDANAANGCETNTVTDVGNCGACGTRCAFANAATSCTGSVCALGACNAGFGNCDGNPANGCETDLRTSPANCGACSNRCAPPNAAGTCAAGVCGLGACTAGFADCDANAVNGCEVNTATDLAHCGACGNLCRNFGPAGSSVCTAGACVPTCNAGYANCDGNANNGCEASVNTNFNCGGCGRACSGICSATGGMCAAGVNISYARSLYRFPPPTLIDACAITGHLTYLPSVDDAQVLVPMPFAMRFWNPTVAAGASINIASNGWIGMDGVASNALYGMIPDPVAPNAIIAPYFTDLVTSAAGVCTAVTGAAPYRRFIVEWADAVLYADRSRHVTFEAILNESGTIEFYYGAMAAPPPAQNITVGLENQAGYTGVVICNPAISCGVVSGQVYGFVPQ
jgi:hypothetical protein